MTKVPCDGEVSCRSAEHMATYPASPAQALVDATGTATKAVSRRDDRGYPAWPERH
jgi:hypothetical protein